tara:strand:- start:21338 stop:21493 length:156 start_codon:yes stop_codon:yes gene_type:complete
MKKGYIGCEHTSQTYLEVAREMKEERERLTRRLRGTQTIQDVIRTKRGKRK